jgi:hypothetical protein
MFHAGRAATLLALPLSGSFRRPKSDPRREHEEVSNTGPSARA